MSKYIIELDENAKEVVVISLEDGDMWTETMEVEDLEQLNSDYINEHYGDLQDTAYQQGLNDAWECARELYLNGACKDMFGEYFNTFIKNHTAQEAIEKLKAHKQDDKIEVGDEVEWDNDFTGDRFIVTRIYQPYGKKEQCDGIDDDGDVYRAVLIESLVKTGRHFDIKSILGCAISIFARSTFSPSAYFPAFISRKSWRFSSTLRLR